VIDAADLDAAGCEAIFEVPVADECTMSLAGRSPPAWFDALDPVSIQHWPSTTTTTASASANKVAES
jgi:hypothetical protein